MTRLLRARWLASRYKAADALIFGKDNGEGDDYRRAGETFRAAVEGAGLAGRGRLTAWWGSGRRTSGCGRCRRPRRGRGVGRSLLARSACVSVEEGSARRRYTRIRLAGRRTRYRPALIGAVRRRQALALRGLRRCLALLVALIALRNATGDDSRPSGKFPLRGFRPVHEVLNSRIPGRGHRLHLRPAKCMDRSTSSPKLRSARTRP